MLSIISASERRSTQSPASSLQRSRDPSAATARAVEPEGISECKEQRRYY